MFKLQKENVIKIVDSSLKLDQLIKQGFALVQAPADFVAEKEELFDKVHETEPEVKKTNTSSKIKK
ncbi:hypothetical protein [Desulfosporosinus youngiae]|uniref:Uncharacterized protein n=1 Tax=Desulfosporosinus youngiae DSM 17734 TaxID=768710 RepID=H5Y569_9FIRM|nr:hypothetical protein [Desulfosporosinus youngiae]EHQ90173.1 hypothetical protein DesyoDRAFT_3139 [Desulfosporosinus youngiae DSM 17734]